MSMWQQQRFKPAAGSSKYRMYEITFRKPPNLNQTLPPQNINVDYNDIAWGKNLEAYLPTEFCCLYPRELLIPVLSPLTSWACLLSYQSLLRFLPFG